MPLERLGHYHLLQQIGSGGMGDVFRAHDDHLDRDVAIKILRSAEVDPSSRRRLLEEARAASQLNHPNICTIYEVGESEGVAYIAMEYIAGRPLSDIIAADGFPTEKVIRYGIQIADALDHAHQHHIVHRDLKPANVVLTAGGTAKVLDFGLARRLQGREIEETTRSTVNLGEYGAAAGTLPYMAPEQLRGQLPDTRWISGRSGLFSTRWLADIGLFPAGR